MPVRFSRALFLLVALGVAVPASSPAKEADGFGATPLHVLAAEQLATRDITRWLDMLETRLTPGAIVEGFAVSPAATLAEFTHRIQAGRISREQERLVTARLDALTASHPDLEAPIRQAAHAITALTIGKSAPEITGVDLDGQPLRLSDYRGRVVVVTFSGEWCGICRSEYPYQRLLVELYRNWPFALLGVESGADPSAAKHAKAEERLNYRSWWENAGPHAAGPIATSWSVTGWPTTFVLDRNGVIRFVDVRKEDLLKSVRQLLDER